jgi:hypothetical protein
MTAAAPSNRTWFTPDGSGWSWAKTGCRLLFKRLGGTDRLPPLTPQAQKAAATDREFRLALGAIDRYVQKGVGGLGGLEIRSGDNRRAA